MVVGAEKHPGVRPFKLLPLSWRPKKVVYDLKLLLDILIEDHLVLGRFLTLPVKLIVAPDVFLKLLPFDRILVWNRKWPILIRIHPLVTILVWWLIIILITMIVHLLLTFVQSRRIPRIELPINIFLRITLTISQRPVFQRFHRILLPFRKYLRFWIQRKLGFDIIGSFPP